MLRILLAGMLISVVPSLSAKAGPTTCAEYTDTFRKIEAAPESERLALLDVRTARMLGFVAGVYHGDTRRPFVLDDETELVAYEQAVLRYCEANPTAPVGQAAIESMAAVRAARPGGKLLSATSTYSNVSLKVEALEYVGSGVSRVVLLVRNDRKSAVSAMVLCSLYGDGDKPLGQAFGAVSDVPPASQAIGEGVGMAEGATRADCRITSVR